ncbi:MAG: class I SAM-dependent methyltransferase [Acidobacteriota bacterium]
MSSLDYFEDVAHRWDSLRRDFFSDDLRDKLFRRGGLDAETGAARALDLGAGTGFVTDGLVSRGLRVTAVDPSPAMLAELRRKHGEGLETHRADAERLPLSDRSFRYAFANMVLHHVERPAAAVAEVWRVLEPGGRFAVGDLDRHDHEFLRTEQHDRWLGFDRAEVRRWFDAAGFVDVRVEDARERCCSSGPCGEEARIDVFIASGTRPSEDS